VSNHAVVFFGAAVQAVRNCAVNLRAAPIAMVGCRSDKQYVGAAANESVNALSNSSLLKVSRARKVD